MAGRIAADAIAAAKRSAVSLNLAQELLGQPASTLATRLNQAKPELNPVVRRPAPACGLVTTAWDYLLGQGCTETLRQLGPRCVGRKWFDGSASLCLTGPRTDFLFWVEYDLLTFS